MFNIVTKNPNYLAKIVSLPEPRKHSNADKLLCVNIDAQNVITGLGAKTGDLYIYFPLECAMNKDYLAWSNSFSSPELNKDTKKKGFFANSGRVKAIKLRGERSEGYIIPVSDLYNWLKDIGQNIDISDFVVGTEFDSFNDILICEKYVNKQQLFEAERAERRMKKKVKRESKLVENQFRLHEDTENLKRNIHKVSPESLISISYKMHGTSVVLSKVLCKKKLNFYEKALKFLGVKIQDTHYDLVYSSRKVIKNAYADKQHQSFYDTDIWGTIAKKYENCLKDGVTIYGEIVNQLPNGKWIQKDFDYGLPPNTCELFVYRMTYTNPTGDVFEFTMRQIQRYCAKYGLKTVPVFYYGLAKDWDSTIKLEEHWHEEFLKKLMEKYNEKKCFMCKNDVPEEGVVLTVESDFFEAYKLKSFAFLEKETKELDKGEVNIEDAESQVTDEELVLAP